MKNKREGFEKRNGILFINVYDLPPEIQEWLSKHRELNRGYTKYHTEFEPYGKKEDFSNTLTLNHLKQYWEDQTNTNNYKGTFDQFIEEYMLTFDKWLIESEFNFKGIREIILER